MQTYAAEMHRDYLAHYAAEGRWITIGGHKGENGARSGGSPVYVQNGRITKGHPSLTGKKISALDAEADHGTHRQQVNQGKGYNRAQWAKKAREAGIDAKSLHQLAGDIQAHDKAFKADTTSLLQEVRKMHPHLQGVRQRSAKGIDADAVRGLDDIASAFANRSEYRHLFAGHEGAEQERLFDMLAQGNPEPMSEDDAYAQALDQLHAMKGRQDHDDPIPFACDWAIEFYAQPMARNFAAEMHASWERTVHYAENAPLLPTTPAAPKRPAAPSAPVKPAAPKPALTFKNLRHENDANWRRFVAFHGGKRIGSADVMEDATDKARRAFPQHMPEGAKAYRVGGIYIDPEHRGQGHGQALYKHVYSSYPEGTRFFNSNTEDDATRTLDALHRNGDIELQRRGESDTDNGLHLAWLRPHPEQLRDVLREVRTQFPKLTPEQQALRAASILQGGVPWGTIMRDMVPESLQGHLGTQPTIRPGHLPTDYAAEMYQSWTRATHHYAAEMYASWEQARQ